MATNLLESGAGSVGAAGAEKGAWSWITPGFLGLLGLTVFYGIVRWYQGVYGWAYGLDSTLPEFDTYWMSVWRAEITLLPIIAFSLWGYLWFTRDRSLSKITPEEEVRRYFILLAWLLVYVFAVYWGASYFAEQDGSWHQTVMRDTSFTPSHIAIFYLSFPIYIIIGTASLLYAVTRLPKYAKNISIPHVIAVSGPFLILPNVGLNEWGHGFWIMEEWFTAPFHWGFVVLGWSGLALFGLAFQIGLHLAELYHKIWGAGPQSEGSIS